MTSLQGKIFLQLSITYIAIPQYAERADYQTIYDIIQKTKGFTFYSILLLNFAQMVCWENLKFAPDKADALKVSFFQKVRCVFQISKKSPKKIIPNQYPELEISCQ